MSAPSTYAEWLEQQGKPVPERKTERLPAQPKARKPGASTNRTGRPVGSRKPRPVRANHVEGGSRFCYAKGCGHDDCYRKEMEYYTSRKAAGIIKRNRVDPDKLPLWFDGFVRGAASL